MLPEEMIALANVKPEDIENAKNQLEPGETYHFDFTAQIRGKLKLGQTTEQKSYYKPSVESLLYLLCEKRPTQAKIKEILKKAKRFDEGDKDDEKKIIKITTQNASAEIQKPETKLRSGKGTHNVEAEVVDSRTQDVQRRLEESESVS